MIKKYKKKVIIVIIIAFAVFFLWQRYFKAKINDSNESTVVKRETVIETVNDSGRMQPVNFANLSFEVPTTIAWVGAEIGDQVKKDQLLIKIDRNQLGAQILAAKLDVEKAVAQEQLARRKWDDYKPEEKDQFIMGTEHARALLAATQSQWKKTELTSPIEGIVTQQDARVGEIASGTVIRIIDPNKMQIEALMSESDITHLHVDQKARITFDAFNDEIFDAHITQIDPESTVLQDVTYYRTIIALEKPDERMRSGMSVDVDIIVQQKDNVLTVPLRFVRSDDAGDYVFIKKGEEFEKQYVFIGVEGDNGNVEVLKGLEEGQEIFAIYEKKNG